jgi:glycosyltransferase involved in cell wall biosynthesis
MRYLFLTMSQWNEPKRARHHYVDSLRQYLPFAEIVWLNRPHLKNEAAPAQAYDRSEERLTVVDPGQTRLPHLLPRIFEELTNCDSSIKAKALLQAISMGESQRTVVISFDYKSLPILRLLPEIWPKYYFCNDFFGTLPKYLYQNHLARYSHGVIATDPRLVDYFKRFNNRTLFLPHGLWYSKNETFRKSRKLTTFVYSGTLNFSLDYELLLRLVTVNQFRLNLVGPIFDIDQSSRAQLAQLLEHDGVKWYGHVADIEKRNAIVRSSDICLLPYKQNFNGNVLKLYDYINLGKPIVATAFDTVWNPKHATYVKIVLDNSSFEREAADYFKAFSEREFHAMRKDASESTWIERTKQLLRFVHSGRHID